MKWNQCRMHLFANHTHKKKYVIINTGHHIPSCTLQPLPERSRGLVCVQVAILNNETVMHLSCSMWLDFALDWKQHVYSVSICIYVDKLGPDFALQNMDSGSTACETITIISTASICSNLGLYKCGTSVYFSGCIVNHLSTRGGGVKSRLNLCIY